PLAGLVPAIHVFELVRCRPAKTWVPGTRPGTGMSVVSTVGPLQPLFVLDDLPEGVLVDDLVALEAVDVAALVIQFLAVRAFAAHNPQRHRVIAGQDIVLALPAHVGDLLEAIAERLADRRLALQRAPHRL